MIARIWHGWTTHQNADIYENMLKTDIFPGIAAKQIAGYRKIQLLRREHADEVEFITIMWFDTLDNIKAFTGDDYETAYVPPEARAVLKRFDARSAHYEMKEEIKY
jgi:antibiotic biosynthesis monooxygenase (ABM) superfamily enzyme